jgi:hypothetical protein
MLLRAPLLPAAAEAAAADSSEPTAVAGGSRAPSVPLGSGRLPLEAAPGAETPGGALGRAVQPPQAPTHDTAQRAIASGATGGAAVGGGAGSAAAEADAEPSPPSPPSPFPAKGGAASVHVRRAEQRLRELLWRDLEQVGTL